MTTEVRHVLEAALKLSHTDRATLIDRLVESLDESADHVLAAWDDEIQRRIDDLDSGRVQPLSWEEASRIISGKADDEPPT